MKTTIHVKTPGIMMVVKGKQIRTPISIKINNEKELKYYETYMKTLSVGDYDIIEDSNDFNAIPEPIINEDYNNEPIIEELKSDLSKNKKTNRILTDILNS